MQDQQLNFYQPYYDQPNDQISHRRQDRIGKIYSNSVIQQIDTIQYQAQNLSEQHRINLFIKYSDFSHMQFISKSAIDQKSTQNSKIDKNDFRIGKIKSVQNCKNINKKSPDIIGKLSKSKLNLSIIEPNPQFIIKYEKKQRSPGHFRSKILFKKRQHQQNHQQQPRSQKPKTNHKQKNLPRVSSMIQQPKPKHKQVINFQSDIQQRDPLLTTRYRQNYLKNLIEKHQQYNKAMFSQISIPKKNIQDFKYNYPVSSRNAIDMKARQKLSPYLERVTQNTKGFRSFIKSSRVSQNKTLKGSKKQDSNNNSKHVADNFQEQILEKSRSIQFKINPEVNISFNVKPSIKQQQEINQQLIFQENSQKTQVSLYNPQKNKNFNNRKPKFIDTFVDILSNQITNSSLKSQHLDLSKYAIHFSRSNLSQNQPSFQQQNLQKDEEKAMTNYQHQHYINIRTKISEIKQLLIESGQQLDLRVQLPSVLFQNQVINQDSHINSLHLLIQKIYQEIKIKPEIVTLRQYRNAIFAAILLNTNNQSSIMSSIIYHFNHGIYIGQWKEQKMTKSSLNTKIQAFRQGNGLEFIYQLQKNQFSQLSTHNIIFQVYLGQYKNNLKQGYGINLLTQLSENSIINRKVQIGCWKNNKKHGWVKTYQNKHLISSADYQNGDFVQKRRNYSPQQQAI